MAASRPRVLKRVTELLNLCLPGTYSASISARNKTRNALAIEDFVDEAGLMILNALAAYPNEFRYPFLTTPAAITTNGGLLPPHLGPLHKILITPYSDADAVEPERRDFRKINSYRSNINGVYSADEHDAEGTDIPSVYDVWEDRLYFTGLHAVITYARLPVRADNLTRIPEIMESTWINLSMGRAAKVGTSAYEGSLLESYAAKGQNELESFKAGARQFQEVDDPKPQSAGHAINK